MQCLVIEDFTKSNYTYAVSTYNPSIKCLALALSCCRLLEWPWTKSHAGIRKPVIPREMLVVEHQSPHSSLALNGMGKNTEKTAISIYFFLPVTFLGTR